jgi:hypothetical protein
MQTLSEQIDYTATKEVCYYFVYVFHLWGSCWQKIAYMEYYTKLFWDTERSKEVDDFFEEIYLDEIRRIREVIPEKFNRI